MNQMATRTWLMVILALGTANAARADDEQPANKPRVAVMDLNAHGVENETVATLTGILLSGLSEGGGIDLLGKADLGKILSLEETKLLVGCPPEDPRCVSEHGQALGNVILVWGSVGKVGDRIVISVAAVDVENSRSLGRGSRNVSAGDGDEMIEATRDLAAEIRAFLGLESLATWTPIMAASVRLGGSFSGYLGEGGELDTWLTSVEVEADFFVLQCLPIFLQIGLSIGGGQDSSDKKYNAYLVPAVVGVKYRWIREWLTPYAGVGVGLGFLDLADRGAVITVIALLGMEVARPNWKRFAFSIEGGFVFNRPIESKDLTQLGGRANFGVIYRF
jgi:TolB-like protein